HHPAGRIGEGQGHDRQSRRAGRGDGVHRREALPPLTAVLMPGGPVADAVFEDLVPRIEKLKENGPTPGLATVLVGEDDASARYVGMKTRKDDALGCNMPHDT